jgi:hypothetical protein
VCPIMENIQSAILQKLADGGDITVRETSTWPSAIREALRILTWDLYVVMLDGSYEITPQGIIELRRLKSFR